MSEVSLAELAHKLKPYIITTAVQAVTGSGGAGAPSPHDLFSEHHTGNLHDSQGPQFLLINGTRGLEGNLGVLPGVTIDTVDISAHVADPDAHHEALEDLDGDSGTAVPDGNNTITIAGGDGIATTGATNTLTIDADPGSNINVTGATINLDIPGTVDVATTNQVTTAHTHAVTASNNPGASTALLKTNTSGELTITGDFNVDSDTLYVDVSEDMIYINSGTSPPRKGSLTVHPPAITASALVIEALASQISSIIRIFDDTGNDLLVVSAEGDLESGNPNFVSGLTGWQIAHDGDAEFNNVWIRGGLHATTFVYDEIHATGGTFAVLTASKLATEVTLPTVGSSVQLNIDASTTTAVSLFAVDDIIRIKALTNLVTGIDIYNLYFTVDSVGTVGGSAPYYYYPTQCTLRWAFPASTSGKKIPAGTAVVKWGEIGGGAGTYTGGMILTADLQYSPYMDVFTLPADITTWTSEPTPTPRVRVGNLDGVLALAEQWGIAFGKDLSDTSLAYGVFSDLQAALHGIEQTWWDTNGNIRGAVDPTAEGTETLLWFGKSSSDRKLQMTGNGLVQVNNVAIGPNRGCIFDGGLIWMSPLGNKYGGYIQESSELDFKAASLDNVDCTWGKYHSGFRMGDSTINYIKNPHFIHTLLTGWDYVGNGVAGLATNPDRRRRGPYSAYVQAGTSQSYLTTEVADYYSLANGATAHLFVWAMRGEGTDTNDIQIYLHDYTNTITRDTATVTAAVGVWQLLHCTWTNNTGSAAQIQILLANQADDSTSYGWFDEVTLNVGTYPRMYSDGDLPSGTWAGTAGDSNTTRGATDIKFTEVTVPTNWTIHFWYMPYMTAAQATVDARLFEWYGDSNDVIRLFQDESANVIRLEYYVNGVLTADNCSDVSMGAFHHFVVTYDGTDLRWWVDYNLEGTLAAGSSFGTTPNQFAIGHDYNFGNRCAGVFSDLFVLNYAISSSDVIALYNSTNPPTVLGDFSFRVHNDPYSSTVITPEGLFMRDVTNVFAVSLSSDTIAAGGVNLQQGDILIGDNVDGKAAIWWDASAGTFGFYGGGSGTVQVEISTTGQVVAGAGKVWLDQYGISLYAPNATPGATEQLKFVNPSGTVVGTIEGYGTASPDWQYIAIEVPEFTGKGSRINLTADAPSGEDGYVHIRAESGTSASALYVLDGATFGDSIRGEIWMDCYEVKMINGTVLDINQLARDDEIIALRSTSDIDHGMTAVMKDTYTFAQFTKSSGTSGGLSIRGATEASLGIALLGYATTDNTAKSTSAVGAVELRGYKRTGTSVTQMGTNANLAVIRDGGVTRFIFDKEGSAHADIEWTTFDAYDDVMLLTSLEQLLVDPVKQEFGEFLQHNKELLEGLKIATFNDDGHHFVNFTRLSMLCVGALRQLAFRIEELERRS